MAAIDVGRTRTASYLLPRLLFGVGSLAAFDYGAVLPVAAAYRITFLGDRPSTAHGSVRVGGIAGIALASMRPAASRHSRHGPPPRARAERAAAILLRRGTITALVQ
nr:hypothetical protein [Mycetohabitans sp. B2]